MSFCNTPIKVFVPKGWDYKEITVKCGNTSPEGTPWMCPECAKANAGRNWRREAMENGEAWGPEDY